MNYKFLSFFLLLFQFVNVWVYSQPPQVEKVADWFQPGYFIVNPTIAKSANEVASACYLSGKDSTIDLKAILNGRNTQSLLTLDKISARPWDPVICLLNTSTKQNLLIDFGWTPSFSPAGNWMAYAAQRFSLKMEERLFADAHKGNSIKLFNTATKAFVEIAKPAAHYFMEPFFVDSVQVAYKTGDKVNGSFGAPISLHVVNTRTKKKTTIRPSAIRFRNYELIGGAFCFNNKLAYVVYVPADTGRGLANEYHHLLLSGRDTLHNFGTKKFTRLTNKWASKKTGDLVVLDDGHLLAEDTNFVVTYKNQTLSEKKPISLKYEKAFLSPTGNRMAYITQDKELWLMNLEDMQKVKIELPKKEFHSFVWSADGTQFAIVQEHGKMAGTDHLYLYQLKK